MKLNDTTGRAVEHPRRHDDCHLVGRGALEREDRTVDATQGRRRQMVRWVRDLTGRHSSLPLPRSAVSAGYGLECPSEGSRRPRKASTGCGPPSAGWCMSIRLIARAFASALSTGTPRWLIK